MRRELQHFTTVDPSKEWNRGFLNWFFRWYGIGLSVSAEFIGLIVAFFIHWSAGVVVIAFGIFFLLLLLVIRHYRLRCLESDQSLHSFFHHSRDDLAKLSAAGNEWEHRQRLDAFFRCTAQRIADFFRERIGDKTVACAIRLAEEVDGQQQYATIARSDRMEPSRAQNTQPIPSDQGIALALRQKEQQGVFIIENIKDVLGHPLWFPTKTDALEDVKSLMIAPVNGWESGSKVMFGILYVTSGRVGKLRPEHTLPMKAFADFLGLIYPKVLTTHHGGEPDG